MVITLWDQRQGHKTWDQDTEKGGGVLFHPLGKVVFDYYAFRSQLCHLLSK